MRNTLYDLRNQHMRHVTLSLVNGNTIKGYIPPPFWVVRGMSKMSCPQNENTHLAIILDRYWKKYHLHFDSGEKLFAELPQGYMEVLLDQIKKIEIEIDMGHLGFEDNTIPVPGNVP